MQVFTSTWVQLGLIMFFVERAPNSDALFFTVAEGSDPDKVKRRIVQHQINADNLVSLAWMLLSAYGDVAPPKKKKK